MFDFFDEDFPLSKKQAEEERKKLAELAAAQASPADDPIIDLSAVTVEEPDDEEPDFSAQYREALNGDIDPGVEDAEEDNEISEPEQVEPAVEDVVEDIAEQTETAAEAAVEEVAEQTETVAEAAVEEVAEQDETAAEAVTEDIAEQVEPAAEAAVEDVAEQDETAEESEIIAEAFREVSENVPEQGKTDDGEAAEKFWEEIASSDDEQTGSYDEWSDFESRLEHASPADVEDLEAHLHEELKSLGEKLDSMERAVDEMEDGELPEGFEYEYDEQYFAEEETPAYKHPELYGKRAIEDDEAYGDEKEDAEPAAVAGGNDPDDGDRASKITMTTNKNREVKYPLVRPRPPRRSIHISVSPVTLAVTAAAAAALAAAIFTKNKKKKK